MLSMCNLFGGLPDFAGHEAVSEKRDDCGFMGTERQTHRQS